MVTIASIDLGSHTARLLMGRAKEGFETFVPLVRKRSYLRLAGDFDPVRKWISREGLARTIAVMKDFSRDIKKFRVNRVIAVATGVIREAANGDAFLRGIFEACGLRIRVISGETEALLSGKGALGGLGIKAPPFLVFDLGGGTTEFLCHGEAGMVVKSVPLGAMVLTKAFLTSDPPAPMEMKALKDHIGQTLARECSAFTANGPVIGTGGTITALCAMHHGILLNAIAPERINGLKLTLFQIERCLDKMRRLTESRRMKELGLDSGRAQVLVAGAAVVVQILQHLGAGELVVSMCDLLEGALMDFFEGEQHG